MTHIVFFLEERSAKEMFDWLLSLLLPQNAFSFQCIHFDGKQSLQKRLPMKLRGWLMPDTLFVVLHDQDDADCIRLENKLTGLCADAKKSGVLVRIACRELESWYLADLAAVERGLGIENLLRHQKASKYRAPDGQSNPAKTLQDLTRGGYTKVAGSRAIGPYLDLDNTRSKSFMHFVTGVRRIAGLPQ